MVNIENLEVTQTSNNDGTTIFKVFDNEKEIAHCCVSRDKEKESFYLSSVAVSPSYQNQGVGTIMLKSVLTRYLSVIEKYSSNHTLCLQVLSHNVPAIKLYAKMGFKITSKIEDVIGRKIYTMTYKKVA